MTFRQVGAMMAGQVAQEETKTRLALDFPSTTVKQWHGRDTLTFLLKKKKIVTQEFHICIHWCFMSKSLEDTLSDVQKGSENWPPTQTFLIGVRVYFFFLGNRGESLGV